MPIVRTPAQLGAVLRHTRVALNLPAADVAAMSGTSAVSLRRLETGDATAALRHLFTLFDELGIEMQLNPPPDVGSVELPTASSKPKRMRVVR